MKKAGYSMILVIAAIIALISSCELLDEGDDTNLDKLEGEWSVNESSSLFKAPTDYYTAYIEPETESSSRYIISNFYDLGFYSSVIAQFGSMRLTISDYTTDDGFIINGTGVISSNYKTIEWEYTVDDGSGIPDEVTATYTKKE